MDNPYNSTSLQGNAFQELDFPEDKSEAEKISTLISSISKGNDPLNPDSAKLEESLKGMKETSAKKKKKIQNTKFSCSLWTSEEFPIKTQEIMTILKTFALGTGNMEKLNKFLQNEIIQTLLEQNGFPVIEIYDQCCCCF